MFAEDLGGQLDATAPGTPSGDADVTGERAGGVATLTLLARDTDEAVFAGRDVPDDRIEDLWRTTAESSESAGAAVGWWRRQVSRFRVNSGRSVMERLTAPRRGPGRRPGGGTK
jgi:hypothetical protein